MKTGVELIAEERKRQIEEEGYSADHDARHDWNELINAALYYALPAHVFLKNGSVTTLIAPEAFFHKTGWHMDCAKRKEKTRIQQLIVAGALIAAEIDRLQRAGEEG